MDCSVCKSSASTKFVVRDNVDYYKCSLCGSIFVDRAQIDSKHSNKPYDEAYWREELSAARSRSFGSSINRVAETFLYARAPIGNFLDIGSGPGYLLDALRILLPQYSTRVWGVELFPPPPQFRTSHENYILGSLDEVPVRVDGGVCIEVIEHLYPDMLEQMLSQLAKLCGPRALFYFNSAQPEFVEQSDPGYLDPFGRGHIISYSIEGLRPIFARCGFLLIRLPGRPWGFLAEYQTEEQTEPDCEALLTRLWSPCRENIDTLHSDRFGSLMHTMGLESARCYLEADRAARAFAYISQS